MIGRPASYFCLRRLSTALRAELKSIPATAKRTNETNPTNHSEEQIGLFYTIPDKTRKELFEIGGFPKSFEANLNTFGETSLMVRKPGLEIINFLKNTDFSKPVIHYVLYGKPGSGKSITLSHIIHYAHINGFYILHVPWVWNWFRNVRTEVTYSTTHEGLVDLPVLAAHWLKHFQCQNKGLLKNTITIKNDYIWNQRESTLAGSSLNDLILHGINRIKYACGCIDAIVKEMKEAAREDKCKVLIAVDGYNALFGQVTNLRTEDKTKVSPDKVTLTQSFLEATKKDWCNGAVVVTVDQMSARNNSLDSHLPLYLLGRKGFEHIDPFIGVEVSNFNDMELHSMLDYYEDRRWLQRIGGRQELSFISNNNPYQLMKLCAAL